MSDTEDYALVPAMADVSVATLTNGKHRGPRFSWTPAYEATFFRSLCESVQMGLREGNTFKQEAWDRAAQALVDRHNAYANKGHMINKTDNARKKFRLWRGLRENPEFVYNPSTKIVAATEDAWRRHIEKEPLSRALKGRPFEHEEYYEVLFSDVIGSGGAPKRVTKARRKGPDSMASSEEPDPPGVMVVDLLGDSTYESSMSSVTNPSSAAIANGVASASESTSHPPSMTPRTTMASPTSLTAADGISTQMRKRYLPTDPNGTGVSANPIISAGTFDKRRRINGYVRPSSSSASMMDSFITSPSSRSSGAGGSGSTTLTTASPSSPSDSVLVLADAIWQVARQSGSLGPPSPKWSERSMDIFFRDFGDEDMDLQVKIAEKVLTDEKKAMLFCKMPVALRHHWVKRLRELHNRDA